MKNMMFIAVLFLAIGIAFAAPAANQFVTNNQTNECALYWSGDEFTYFALPENWTIVEINITYLNETEATDLMNTTCQNMSYVYIGRLTNLTGTCIRFCEEGTVLNETTCMCDIIEVANDTNETINETINQTANETNETPLLGGDRDAHGCIPSAGYSWCEEKQKCLRIWEENCTEPQANLTTNDTTTSLQVNLKEQFSDPYVIGALGIIVIAIIVMFYFRAKKAREHAENFQFPPP